MATQITVKRQGSRLVPVSPQDEDLLRREFREGEPATAELKRYRSMKHNRWYHALLDIVAENHEVYDTHEKLAIFLKVRLGLIEDTVLIDAKTGAVQYILKSTSFGRMGQRDFMDFTNRALDVILQEVWSGKVPKSELIVRADQRSGVAYKDLIA